MIPRFFGRYDCPENKEIRRKEQWIMKKNEIAAVREDCAG